MKRIILAFDSYKGCLSSSEVADTASVALKESVPQCETVTVPLADGGEGTVDSIAGYLGGIKVSAFVSDPVGRPIMAEYAISGSLAIIESASCLGLSLLTDNERNPLKTSSRGLGELILDAIGRGCTSFIIGLGGSATNDGGRGMVEVPGFLSRARGMNFSVACDVMNPFVGVNGASRVFGPQKGASAQEIEMLEKRMYDYSLRILDETGVDVRDMPGAGAAGGLGGAFKAFLGAELKRGIDFVLDIIHFEEVSKGADLIITGEGRSDAQTLMGKCASGVLARSGGIPVVLMSGSVRDVGLLSEAGFAAIVSVTPEGMSLAEGMKGDVARKNIKRAIISLTK